MLIVINFFFNQLINDIDIFIYNSIAHILIDHIIVFYYV